MSVSFSDTLFNRVKPIWNAYLVHPFVKGIGDGTLDKSKFIHYMKQDYIYLIEYSRLFAIGASKTKDLTTMTLFGDLLHGTLSFEMDLHRSYAKRLGISKRELETTEPAEITTSYTSYMLAQALLGGIENCVATVLTCAWSYHFIGKELNKNPTAKEHEFYADWIKTYVSDDFSDLVNKCIVIIDEIGQYLSDRDKNILENIVIKTSYYEYLFWNMAEKKSTWDIPIELHHI